jgi:hypothetical protein
MRPPPPLIHRSAWKGFSAKFAITEFYGLPSTELGPIGPGLTELRVDGVLRSSLRNMRSAVSVGIMLGVRAWSFPMHPDARACYEEDT